MVSVENSVISFLFMEYASQFRPLNENHRSMTGGKVVQDEGNPECDVEKSKWVAVYVYLL